MARLSFPGSMAPGSGQRTVRPYLQGGEKEGVEHITSVCVLAFI